jgi:hydrogenase/urease accessory protein HupE
MRDLRNAMDDTSFVTTDEMRSPISEMISHPVSRISYPVSRNPFQILFFRLLLPLLVIFTLPVPVEAHLNSTGMGPIYDGLMHFLMTPEDLVPAFALALLAGMRGAAYGRRASFTLPVAWLLGSLFGLTAAAATGSVFVSSFWFLLLGGLVIADAKLSLRAMTVLAALLGLVHGYLNGTGMGLSGFSVVAVLGLTSGVFILIALAAAFVVQLQAHWARIAVRVAGSWIAASGLLMLGWSFRGS